MISSRTVRWTGPALDDLRTIRQSLSRGSAAKARTLADRIRTGTQRLTELPELGRLVPEFPGSNLREIIVPPYRIIYTLRTDLVVILRVWHGRRDLTKVDWEE